MADVEENKPEATKTEAAKPEAARTDTSKPEGNRQGPEGSRQAEDRRPNRDRDNRDRDNRGGPGGGGGAPRGNREGRGGGDSRGADTRGHRDRPGGGPRPEGAPEIDLEKLMADSLYLDNQAHVVVSRMRDMDSGTKSQLRRLYNAVRRATRTPEAERQHEFVMVRARLAYTIARHSLRSLDALERLLLQVTRKNDGRGYERFRDLFEAIIAYNE